MMNVMPSGTATRTHDQEEPRLELQPGRSTPMAMSTVPKYMQAKP